MTSASDDPFAAPWMDDAACVGYPMSWWFPEGVNDMTHVPKAIKICQVCVVREQCLAFALEHDDRHGIFGGTTPEQRYEITYNKPLRKDNRWLR